MTTLWRDFRFGLQGLLRSPGFTAVAVATLALGIGANSAIFSIVSGVLLNALPWKDPTEVVLLMERNQRQPDEEHGVSSAKYFEWKEQARSFRAMGAVRFWGLNLTDDEAELDFVSAAMLTPEVLPMLGIRPQLGRVFSPEEAEEGSEPVAILTHGIWQRRYGGDSEIVGRTIEVDSEPVTVVGVLPQDQWVPAPWVEVLTPLQFDAERRIAREDHSIAVYGRLAPGVDLAQAQVEMDLISNRLAEAYPQTDADWRARATLVRDEISEGNTARGITIMMVAVGIVLLIACANVANLLLARAAARRKEIAVRAAIGATRAQLLVQLLGESLALAAIALPFALLVTRWVLDFLLTLPPPTVTYLHQFFRFDAPVVGFAAALTFATVLLFGLVPALEGSRADLNEGLKEGGARGATGGRRQRLRSILVVAQIALALTLLVCAGLAIQGFRNQQKAEVGFDVDGLLATSLTLPQARYPEAAHWKQFQRDVRERIAAIPGVESAASVNHAPFWFGATKRDFDVRGDTTDPEVQPRALWYNVSSDYFGTMGIPLVQGRDFESTDREDSVRVAIVNEMFARRHFEGRTPLGEILQIGDGVEMEIVGVVGDVRNWGAAAAPEPQMFVPFVQEPWSYMSLVARVSRPEDEVRAQHAIRQVVRSLDPELPVFTLQTMRQRMQVFQWQGRLFAIMMTSLGALALVLAAVGVYGVVSYSTAQRTREFGIRSALGAEPRQIAGLVVREAGRLAILGVSIGLVLSAGAARGLSAVLYEVDTWDPATFLGIALLLSGVTLAASVVPAWRATRADPVVALRAE